MPASPVIITIDGPAGTGKSTVAHGLARRLGLDFLDTGAMYRAAALLALRREIGPDDGAALAAALGEAELHFDWACDPPRVLLGEHDVSEAIRGLDVSGIVSIVAAQPEVRAILVDHQRNIAGRHPRLVSEGRDQGSVVFPAAAIKFYLHADVKVRARRRVSQLASGGRDIDHEAVIEDIRRRDRLDATRPDGPLIRPGDAIDIDTGERSAEAVIDLMESIAREKLPDAAIRYAGRFMSFFRRFQVGRRASGANPLRILFVWDVVRPTFHLWFKLCYRLRLVGQEKIPRHGPVIYASNHQSHFDPIAVGILIHDRPLTALARASLFRFPLSIMMRTVGVIPIERGKGDRGAIKTALGVLESGRCVAMYPEGTRSVDGSLGAFHNGVLLLARRSGAPVVPIAVEGAWDIWPKGRPGPHLFGRVAVRAGDPISADELREEGDHALERLRREIETMRMELRAHIRATSDGRMPAPGPGDIPYWEHA